MSEKFPQEAKKIMDERFGHDTLLSLATTDQNIPYVRTVNAYYEDGCFYIITYAASNKMKQIGNNPIVAVAGEWFTAHGKGINLGWFCKKENHEMAQKLRQACLTTDEIMQNKSIYCKVRELSMHPQEDTWPLICMTLSAE